MTGLPGGPSGSSSLSACPPSEVVVFSREPMDHSTPGFPVLHCLLEFAQTLPDESVMPPNPLILCLPLLLLPSIFPSIRVFSNESALCIRWPKYWSFSFHPSIRVYSYLSKLSLYFLNLSASSPNSFTLKKTPQIHQQHICALEEMIQGRLGSSSFR